MMPGCFRDVSTACSARSLLPKLGGGVENGAHHLVVAGAATEVAGEPVARLGLRRVRVAVEQGFRRDQDARRAEAALERRVLEEFSLQRMQLMSARNALDGLDRVAVRLDREHQARADQTPVDR